MSNSGFKGPLFIVGLPRSGTKLLRDLLNQHPNIGMPNVETQFLPYWSRHWDKFGDLSNRENFNYFYQAVIRLPYFITLSKNTQIISQEHWFSQCKSFDIPGIFEALIRHDVNAAFDSSIIWGDKTPSYIIHIPFLKSLFPNAKFIHIVRDVRDHCLSSNKAWGKNMVRAAVRWQERLVKFRLNLPLYQSDIHELKYENLLDNHDKELHKICDFLALPFDPAILNLSKPSENLGDAKGFESVVRSNKNKYQTEMSSQLRNRIEGIAKSSLKYYGYPISYNGNVEHVGKFKIGLYRLMDGFNLVRFEMKEQGVFKAINFRWSLYKTSGNRPLERS